MRVIWMYEYAPETTLLKIQANSGFLVFCLHRILWSLTLTHSDCGLSTPLPFPCVDIYHFLHHSTFIEFIDSFFFNISLSHIPNHFWVVSVFPFWQLVTGFVCLQSHKFIFLNANFGGPAIKQWWSVWSMFFLSNNAHVRHCHYL